MKKIGLFLVIIMVCISCNKNSDKIEVVKNYLSKEFNLTQDEINLLSYDIVEISGKDAYKCSINLLKDQYSDYTVYEMYTEANEIKIQLDSSKKSYDKIKNKTYYRIIAYKMKSKDVVKKTIFYITDNNKVYNFTNLK